MSVNKFELGMLNSNHQPSHSPHADPVKLNTNSINGDVDHCIHATRESSPLNQSPNEPLSKYIHIDTHPNGGASVVHMYQEEIQHLDKQGSNDLAKSFFTEVFREDKRGNAKHVMGIVHRAASYLPELLTYLSNTRPELIVKVGHLRKSEIETSTMEEYVNKVEDSYSHGTFRYGPLLQLSIVGQFSEESGGYFPELLGELIVYVWGLFESCRGLAYTCTYIVLEDFTP